MTPRSRIGLLVLICALVVYAMVLIPVRASTLARPTATSPPILLVVNSVAGNKFGA